MLSLHEQSTLATLCREGDLKFVKRMLQDYDNIIIAWERAWSDNPILAACAGGNIEIVELLESKGLVLDHYEDIISAAASGGHVRMINYLLQRNLRVCNHLEGPLMHSIVHGHLQAVKYFVSHGADIHARYDEPFVQAAINNRLEIVKYLIQKGSRFWHRTESFQLFSPDVKSFLKRLEECLWRNGINSYHLESNQIESNQIVLTFD